MTKVFEVVLIVLPTAELAAKGTKAEVVGHQVVSGDDATDAVKKVLVGAKNLPADPNLIEVQVKPFN